MDILHSAKRMVGKALSTVHAGDEKLIGHQPEVMPLSSRRIEIHSDAFPDNGQIPVKFSGEGLNVSPPLRWNQVPPEAKELVVICEDPDAPFLKPFMHWSMLGINPQTHELPEAIPHRTLNGDGPIGDTIQLDNSAHKPGYTGPIPPTGHGPHHYHFQIFALDESLDLDEDATREELLERMKGHVLAMGEVVGVYERN